jgi:peptide methionine sulfoxide reductase msrA/msrB
MFSSKTVVIGLVLLVIGVVAYFVAANLASSSLDISDIQQATRGKDSGKRRDFLVAGGCFWCVEHDLQKVPGVFGVVSGYAGGSTDNPTYENYAAGGHREVVRVTYDPQQVSEFGLLVYALKHMDPTNGQGSFNDRGKQYAPALYFENNNEKLVAEAALEFIRQQNVFDSELQVELLQRPEFWPAEEYHQDYAQKNSLKYSAFRLASGRDGFIERHWGKDKAAEIPETPDSLPELDGQLDEQSFESKFANYKKPAKEELQQMLTDLQFEVTQEEGTELPFDNAYWDNKKEGIYVDILSGEPLFCSTDKFESGTGWPSFTRPIDQEFIELKDDWGLFYKRIEVRSKYGDNHIGHVFDDGPTSISESGGAAPTGLRWCMNSAALEFIPREKMAEKGYAQFLFLFETTQ